MQSVSIISANHSPYFKEAFHLTKENKTNQLELAYKYCGSHKKFGLFTASPSQLCN